jgi:hypothetical protein
MQARLDLEKGNAQFTTADSISQQIDTPRRNLDIITTNIFQIIEANAFQNLNTQDKERKRYMQRSLYNHILAYAYSINKDVTRASTRRYSKSAIDYAIYCVENRMYYELKSVITGDAPLAQFQTNSNVMRTARNTITQRNRILRKGVTLFASSRPLAGHDNGNYGQFTYKFK